MKALILVGGFGTRLRPLTLTLPKPLVEFCNKPMILHQIEGLVKVGVKDIVLAVNYRPEIMVNLLQKYEEKYNVKITFSVEEVPLGTAGPLALAKKTLGKDQSPFFVLNSDIICEYPFEELRDFHIAHGNEGTIVVTKAPPGSKCVDNAGLAKFEFVQNKKYRLRIINTSAFSAFFFSIDNHEMEVIEADGGYTNRNKIHRLPINVAQRYSVIVTANQPVDNYIMRSEFQKKCMPDAAASLPTIKAIVHYEGAPDGPEPKDNPWSDSLTECVDLDHKTLQPLKEEKIPESTRKLELTIAFHKNTTGVVKAFLNESSYIPDINFPSLDKIFKGKPISETSANAYFFDKDGEVVDIYFVNTDDGDHPFHIV
ncbi:14923_t:CDS:2, partial [Entrophospora sp. SA101]